MMRLPPFHFVFLVAYILVFLSGTFGNFLVIKWFGSSKKKKISGSTLVVALAVNDLVASILVPFSMMNQLITSALDPPFAWFYGKIGCYLIDGVGNASLFATSWILVSISFVRLW